MQVAVGDRRGELENNIGFHTLLVYNILLLRHAVAIRPSTCLCPPLRSRSQSPVWAVSEASRGNIAAAHPRPACIAVIKNHPLHTHTHTQTQKNGPASQLSDDHTMACQDKLGTNHNRDQKEEWCIQINSFIAAINSFVAAAASDYSHRPAAHHLRSNSTRTPRGTMMHPHLATSIISSATWPGPFLVSFLVHQNDSLPRQARNKQTQEKLRKEGQLIVVVAFTQQRKKELQAQPSCCRICLDLARIPDRP
jgi:hypothetical protein